MAVPPKGDPRRPLVLAARSMRGLGILLLILAAVPGLVVLLMSAKKSPDAEAITAVSTPAGLGGALLVAGANLRKGRAWAAVVGMVLASLALAASVLFVAVGIINAAFLEPDLGPAVWILPAVALLFVLAFGQLVVQLARSFAAIRLRRQEGPEEGHGFRPILMESMEDRTQI